MAGIIGRKIGMTNIFDEEGRLVPVTLIQAGPCFVLGLRTAEKEGYSAVILGFGEKKAKNVTKPLKGWFEKLKIAPTQVVREVRSALPAAYKAGETVKVTIFKSGDYVDVRGTTIGKGFQGGVKRWHWGGGDKSHGSMHHRAVGSIGASSFPSRVHKGKTLPGHMGFDRRTSQNLKVAGIDEEKNILLVRGSVPGPNGSILIVKHAVKRPPKESRETAKQGKDEKGNEQGNK